MRRVEVSASRPWSTRRACTVGVGLRWRHNRAVATTQITPAAPCPCGLGLPYRDCCGRFHGGQATAPTAETLMRSRFCAFAVNDEAYLLRTWHPTTRPPRVRFDPEDRWSRLDILGRTGGGLLDADGTVEFRAHYSHRGNPGALHENSRFVRDTGSWVYLSPVPAGS
jgi:SEC-C motif-containing protein